MIQAFQFAVGIVLARLLEPKDFGVFAVTGIFTGLAANVANIGLGAALVQRQSVEERHRRTMLVTNLTTSSVIVGLLILAAPWVGRYFQHPLAGRVLVVVSFNFLINSLSSVSFSTLSRKLKFRSISIVEAGAMPVHAAVAVGMARHGYGVWSIASAGRGRSPVRCRALLCGARRLPRPGREPAAPCLPSLRPPRSLRVGRPAVPPAGGCCAPASDGAADRRHGASIAGPVGHSGAGDRPVTAALAHVPRGSHSCE